MICDKPCIDIQTSYPGMLVKSFDGSTWRVSLDYKWELVKKDKNKCNQWCIPKSMMNVHKERRNKERIRFKELANISVKNYVTVSFTKKHSFITSHNGANPFKFIANQGIIKLYVRRTCFAHTLVNDNKYKLLYNITNHEGYWIGYDTSSYKFHGNTLLIKINKKKYIYIGNMNIYEFTFPEPIIHYISMMGNNDIPEPLAITEKYIITPSIMVYYKRSDFMTPIKLQYTKLIVSETYGNIGINSLPYKKLNGKILFEYK